MSSLSVPQIGIVGALGIATIAAPISGLMSGPPAKAALNEISTPRVAVPAFPFLEHLPSAVEDVHLITDDVQLPSIPSALAPPRTLLVTRPSRGHERAVLPGCFGNFPALTKMDNGRLPNSVLSPCGTASTSCGRMPRSRSPSSTWPTPSSSDTRSASRTPTGR